MPMEGTRWEVAMGMKLTSMLVRHLLGPLDLSGPIAGAS